MELETLIHWGYLNGFDNIGQTLDEFYQALIYNSDDIPELSTEILTEELVTLNMKSYHDLENCLRIVREYQDTYFKVCV